MQDGNYSFGLMVTVNDTAASTYTVDFTVELFSYSSCPDSAEYFEVDVNAAPLWSVLAADNIAGNEYSVPLAQLTWSPASCFSLS